MTAPQITSSAFSLDFGSEVAGKLSDPQTVTFTNIGNANLIIGDTEVIGAAPADFGLTVDFCSFQVLPPGADCEIELSMRPTAIGERTAQLVIENNDPDQDLFIIDLKGKGTGSGGCQLNHAASTFDLTWILLAILILAAYYLPYLSKRLTKSSACSSSTARISSIMRRVVGSSLPK